MNTLINKSRSFAIDKHQNQSYGNYPYIYHLDQVYKLVCEAGLSINMQIAAYLHDTLEDTQTSLEELTQKFNPQVGQMVFCVSGFGKNRKERNEDIYKKLLEYPEYIHLKLADRIANMRHSRITNPKLYQMYCKELETFKHLAENANPYLKNILNQEFNQPATQPKMK